MGLNVFPSTQLTFDDCNILTLGGAKKTTTGATTILDISGKKGFLDFFSGFYLYDSGYAVDYLITITIDGTTYYNKKVAAYPGGQPIAPRFYIGDAKFVKHNGTYYEIPERSSSTPFNITSSGASSSPGSTLNLLYNTVSTDGNYALYSKDRLGVLLFSKPLSFKSSIKIELTATTSGSSFSADVCYQVRTLT